IGRRINGRDKVIACPQSSQPSSEDSDYRQQLRSSAHSFLAACLVAPPAHWPAHCPSEPWDFLEQQRSRPAVCPALRSPPAAPPAIRWKSVQCCPASARWSPVES